MRARRKFSTEQVRYVLQAAQQPIAVDGPPRNAPLNRSDRPSTTATRWWKHEQCRQENEQQAALVAVSPMRRAIHNPKSVARLRFLRYRSLVRQESVHSAPPVRAVSGGRPRVRPRDGYSTENADCAAGANAVRRADAQREALKGHLVLARRCPSRRIEKIETYSPRNHVHVFRLRSEEDLDTHFQVLVSEAYKVGRQEHLE
jgi:hypothetical protein